ncbi:META domain-containing protein [Sphingomonas daechungensis]|uniref:META domain-containing protein n=1 Tax=Sphingomonas daechungensis TaxID=1176646 RepID=UPI003784A474
MKAFLALPVALLLNACMTYPPPSTAPYRAIGTEPFWSLVIDDRDVTFIPAGGEPIRQPRPPAIVGIAGEIYQTPRIHVNIVHAHCSDGMSDKIYSDKVQVDVDGKRFNGCGGDPVAPATLAGTNWRVESVNGRPTPQQGDYFVQFDADRVSAKFGCNSMSGGYSVGGDTLNVGAMAMTRMFCPEPAMSFENQGAKILGQPVTMKPNGDRLTLSNSAGTIELSQTF